MAGESGLEAASFFKVHKATISKHLKSSKIIQGVRVRMPLRPLGGESNKYFITRMRPLIPLGRDGLVIS